MQVGFQAIVEALGIAAVKAIVAITGIIAGGRLVWFMLTVVPLHDLLIRNCEICM